MTFDLGTEMPLVPNGQRRRREGPLRREFTPQTALGGLAHPAARADVEKHAAWRSRAASSMLIVGRIPCPMTLRRFGPSGVA